MKNIVFLLLADDLPHLVCQMSSGSWSRGPLHRPTIFPLVSENRRGNRSDFHGPKRPLAGWASRRIPPGRYPAGHRLQTSDHHQLVGCPANPLSDHYR